MRKDPTPRLQHSRRETLDLRRQLMCALLAVSWGRWRGRQQRVRSLTLNAAASHRPGRSGRGSRGAARPGAVRRSAVLQSDAVRTVRLGRFHLAERQ